jgi:preprotein translocase subunit SecB
MASPPESGFRFLNILILESNFKREVLINFQQPIESVFDLDVSSEKVEQTNQYVVQVKAILKGLQAQKTEFSVEVKMVGVFEKFGAPDFSDEQFTNVNGPAIIFPFIREHIASLALKAGIGTVLLPPLNFTKK